jgi:polysaccharide biosynthesis PFTS motif protein
MFKVLEQSDLKYKNFVEQGKLSELRKIIRKCIDQEADKISTINQSLKPKFVQQIETQICLDRISHLLLNPKIVRQSIKARNKIGLIYPLHESWINTFVVHGVKVNRNVCKALYQIYLMQKLTISYYKFINNFFKKNCRKPPKLGNVIVQISSNVNTSTFEFKDSLNFKNWLREKKLVSSDDMLTFLSTNRQAMAENGLHTDDIFKLGKIESIKRLFLMSHDNPKNTIKYFFRKPDLLFQYLNFDAGLFKNVEMIIVPSSEHWIKQIWHFKAEELGIKVVFVNLSDSVDASMTFDNDSSIAWTPLSNWQSVVVCSENQAEAFLRHCNKIVPPEIELLGVPDWTDFHDERLTNLNRFVAIFDNEPHKGYYGLSSNNDCGFFEIENALKFLDDIIQVSSKLNINCVLKPKRKLSNKTRYTEYFNGLRHFTSEYTNFHFLDERVAPKKIIRASLASINLPFTSTGLIARECGVPTCFYDPVGRINISDPGSSGIKIINNIKSLQIWLDEVIQLK